MAFEYLSQPSTTVVPSALNTAVYWYDSGTTEGGKSVYYDESDTYAYWYTGTIDVITIVADVGSLGSNYFNDSLVGQGAWSGTLTLTAGCASNWEWQAVNRNRDYSIVSNTEFFRENWQLTRYRFSNLPYVSQLGDTEDTSISAYNAGVTESVTPPTWESLQFLDLTWAAWVDSDNNYVGYKFYKAIYEFNGKPAYVSPTACSVFTGFNLTAGMVPIVLSDGAGDWFMVGDDRSNADSGNLTYTTRANYAANGLAITSDWTSDAADLPTVATDVEFVEDTVPFRCTSDLQSYDQRSVDWFKQTQTWIARSPWG